jgi:hypothetical protein
MNGKNSHLEYKRQFFDTLPPPFLVVQVTMIIQLESDFDSFTFGTECIPIRLTIRTQSRNNL